MTPNMAKKSERNDYIIGGVIGIVIGVPFVLFNWYNFLLFAAWLYDLIH